MAFGGNELNTERDGLIGRETTILLPEEAKFERAWMECMRNMLAVVTYSSGASYLVHRHPPVFGPSGVAIACGAILFVLALRGVHATAKLFLDALLLRFVDVTQEKWRHRVRRGTLMIALMVIFALMASIPWFIMKGLPA